MVFVHKESSESSYSIYSIFFQYFYSYSSIYKMGRLEGGASLSMVFVHKESIYMMVFVHKECSESSYFIYSIFSLFFSYSRWGG